MLTTDIYWLFFWRFVQGLGVSATILMGRVIINDSYPNYKAANYIRLLICSGCGNYYSFTYFSRNNSHIQKLAVSFCYSASL